MCFHRIAYVDFNFWEVKRALKLNNTDWLGEKIKVNVDGEDLLNDYNREQTGIIVGIKYGSEILTAEQKRSIKK